MMTMMMMMMQITCENMLCKRQGEKYISKSICMFLKAKKNRFLDVLYWSKCEKIGCRAAKGNRNILE